MTENQPSETNGDVLRPGLTSRVHSEVLTDASSESKPAAQAKKPEAAPKTRAQLLFQGQLNPTKKRKIIRLEQWVDVTIQNGVTVTKQVPNNHHMIRKGQKMWPPPEFVYRRINFPQGIPDEYAWTCVLNPEMRQYGGCGIQRMLIDDWLDAIEREEKRGDGHVGPIPRGNLPRPAEHGECDCPVCTLNRPRLGHLIGASADIPASTNPESEPEALAT